MPLIETKRFDQRAGARRGDPTDRRVDLKIDFRKIDDDAIGIGNRPRRRLDRTRQVEGQPRAVALIEEMRRYRDRRLRFLGSGARAREENRRPKDGTSFSPHQTRGAANVHTPHFGSRCRFTST